MKKYIPAAVASIFCAVLLLSLIIIKTPGKADGQGTTPPPAGTTASTVPTTSTTAGTEPVTPPFPEAPEGLTESVRYDFGDEGIMVIKSYLDKNGNAAEEHIYTVDGTLSILCPYVIAVHECDKYGALKSSSLRYIKNPSYAAPEKVIKLSKSDKTQYTYTAADADGNVLCYVSEQTDRDGNAICTKYYTASGKLLRTESAVYENGTLRSFVCEDSNGKTLRACTYDEKGNVISATVYSAGSTLSASVGYYGDGGIQYCNVKQTEQDGTVSYAADMLFGSGRITKNGDKKISYHKNGKPAKVSFTDGYYSFDEEGRLTLAHSYVTGGSYTYEYFYGEDGKLAKINQSNGEEALGHIDYIYNPDGSYTMETYEKDTKTGIAKFDRRGNTVYEQTYKGGTRANYSIYEYDVYGNLTKQEYHSEGKLVRSAKYTLNADGELTRAEHEEYGADGKPISRKICEYSDFGNTVTEYDSSGAYTYTKYDAYGKMTETKTVADGHEESVFYEYYESGAVLSATTYKDGEFAGSNFYLANGNIAEMMLIDENGVLITSKYLRVDDTPVRIDVYAEGRLAAYTLIEYYSYVSDSENTLKSMYTYSAAGEPVYRIEYVQIPLGGVYNTVLAAEEYYENGVPTQYTRITYSESTGTALKKETLINGVLTESEYRSEKLHYEKITAGGKLVSLYEAVNNWSPTTYAETFYDENGRETHKYTYNAHSETREKINSTDVYEYATDGTLLKIKTYNSKRLITTVSIYGEGRLITQELYSYDSEDVMYRKSIRHYNEAGLVAHSIIYANYSGDILEELKCEYFENGDVSKRLTVRYSNGVPNNTTETHFNEAGKAIYQLTEFAGRKKETFTEYDENGIKIKETVYVNGILQ
ncbi:MAG: hypothetical protein IJW21_05360 [Clostridia bacterium]|nr:hypothetical protein [Clostridia bacterium]